MRDLLFLSHRIPYPPDKGEKIRAWHFFLHLARTHRMHLGCFLDDFSDRAHIEDLRRHCADLHVVEIDRARQKALSLLRARPGRPLTLGYFADAGLHAWVRAKLAGGIEESFVYCSAMAPYLMGARGVRRVLDMVDVDSAKWAEYAARAAWPARAVWAREARTLLAFERKAAADFDRTLFVSEAEAAAFHRLAPEVAARVGWMDNGVDLVFFSPAHGFQNPLSPRAGGGRGLGEGGAATDFRHPASRRPPLTQPSPPDAELGGEGHEAGPTIVFTGTMDYWPNVDAVTWFSDSVLPAILARHPRARFVVVGANPAPAVQKLADRQNIVVTGRVPDVRPYVAHAALVVAPLRIARGIQNKVLEAMAMGRPVLATPQAFEGLHATPGRDLLLGADAAALAALAIEVLDGTHKNLGVAARAAVEKTYAWDATLAGLDALFAAPLVASLPHEAIA